MRVCHHESNKPAHFQSFTRAFAARTYFVCASSESSGEIKKMRRLIGFVTVAINEKSHVLTHTYVKISHINTLQVYLGQWTIPDTCICRTNKGCYVHVMCKMLVLLAKTGKRSANFLRFDIKLKKSRTGFELVTVLISEKSFFQHRVWPV